MVDRTLTNKVESLCSQPTELLINDTVNCEPDRLKNYKLQIIFINRSENQRLFKVKGQQFPLLFNNKVTTYTE